MTSETGGIVDEQAAPCVAKATWVTTDTQYNQVSEQVRYHNERIIEAFNLYIKLYTGIVAGVIWISMQSKISTTRFNGYARISNILVIVLAAFASLLVFENLRAWRGYRQAQHRLDSSIPEPRPFRSAVTESAMVIGMFLASGLFIAFNPLS